jgi:branched-chain amino acid transport system substrate-binding protein
MFLLCLSSILALPFGQTISPNHLLISKDKNFYLGSTLPLSGSVSMIGRDINYGANLVFNKLNRSGGLNGSLLKFSTLDDRYDPFNAMENIKELSTNSPLLFGMLGAESVSTIFPMLETNQLALMFPVAGDSKFRNSSPRYLIHYRASIEQELEALVEYAVKIKRRRKIAIFYEANWWGEGAVENLEAILKKRGLKLQAKASYIQNTPNVATATKTIVASKPDAVICVSQSRPAYHFIQSCLNSGLQNSLFLGVGELAPIQKIIKKSRGINLVISSVVPSPWKDKGALAKQFRADAKKYLANRKISQFLFEGYAAAAVLVAALKKIEKGATLENLLQYFENIKLVRFGGISLSFNSKERSLCHDVWINEGSGVEWTKVKPIQAKPIQAKPIQAKPIQAKPKIRKPSSIGRALDGIDNLENKIGSA